MSSNTLQVIRGAIAFNMLVRLALSLGRENRQNY